VSEDLLHIHTIW